MIVVVIIGLLAAMAVPTWQKIRTHSQDKTITNNLRQLNGAAQQYFMEQGADSVASASLIGTETDRYLRNVETVRGEAYPATINSTDTQLVAVSGVGNVSYSP